MEFAMEAQALVAISLEGSVDKMETLFSALLDVLRWKQLDEKEKVLTRIAIGSVVVIGIAAVLLVMFGPEVYFYG